LISIGRDEILEMDADGNRDPTAAYMKPEEEEQE
jgi:hypothetical protein